MTPKTRPPYYHKSLTYESKIARARTEDALKQLFEELETADFKTALVIERKIEKIEKELQYQAANPKKIPFKDVKHMAQAPLKEDPLIDKYRKGIKNRQTAIRALCVSCMSGQVALVRQCLAVSCPLWPFRMGKNPFHGYDIPKLNIETQVDEEDKVFEVEDDEDGNS